MLKQLYANFSIIPLNGKTPIWKNWTKYKNHKPPFESLEKHKGNFGVVCGFDGLEVIDIESTFSNSDALLAWINDNFDLSNFLILKTNSGGYHIYFKCDNVGGSTVFAKRRYVPEMDDIIVENNNKYCFKPGKKEGKKYKLINDKLKKEWFCNLVMVETRGKGGQVVFYDNIIKGSIDAVPKITDEQRNNLFEVCRALNEVAEKNILSPKERVKVNGQLPGDAYNNDALSVEETFKILLGAGWTTNDNVHWWRPGKELKEGPSATFGKVGINRFYNFSANGHPFEERTSNSMFGVRAILKHEGDFRACAKELAEIYNINVARDESERKKKNKWEILDDIISDWDLRFRYNKLTTVIDVSIKKKPYEKIGLLVGDIIREMETKRKIKSISKSKVIEMLSNSKVCLVYDPN